MSFSADTPIGLLPYAITPQGEVQFLFWKSATTSQEHSALFYGDCAGIKDRFDQSMWDVCARTWAENSGGLYAISEELRSKREKREKKELKALSGVNSTTTSDKKSDKKDKKSKKEEEKTTEDQKSKTTTKTSPSITTYPTHEAIFNNISESTETETATTPVNNNISLFSTESKKFKNFQLLYKTFSPAQWTYNSSKLVRKLLTSRQSSVVTLTNDNFAKPKFVYCIQIEFMPIWMINYILKQHGNGDCIWVHGYELIKYLSLQQIASIPQEYNDQVKTKYDFSLHNDSQLQHELAKYLATQKENDDKAIITPQIESEAIVFDMEIWKKLVSQRPPTTTTTPATKDVKDELPKKLVYTREEWSSIKTLINNQSLIQQTIPLNLPLLSVLTVASLLKFIKLCNNILDTTKSSPLYKTPTTPKPYIRQYDLPQYLTQYNDDFITARQQEAEEDEHGTTKSNPTFELSPSQRQQLALDIQQSNCYYKCRQCRRILFASSHLATHQRFDFDRHLEKANEKHQQQQNRSLQPLRKTMNEAKAQVAKSEKAIRKYILKLRIQAEIAQYGSDDYGDEDFDEDDDEDDDFDEMEQIDEGDENDDEEDMFVIAQRNRAKYLSSIANDEEEDEDDEDESKGLVLAPELYDQSLLTMYYECYDAILLYENGGQVDEDEVVAFIQDDYDYAHRKQFIQDFKSYEDSLKEFHDEKHRLEEQATLNQQQQQLDSEMNDEEEQVSTAFGETKGNGIYVKTVFGKASTKGFSNVDNACQSIFLEGSLGVFPPTLVPMNSSEGNILCRYCNYRMGTYSWSGSQCSCGQWVVPGIQIPVSKIDFSFKEKYQQLQVSNTAQNPAVKPQQVTNPAVNQQQPGQQQQTQQKPQLQQQGPMGNTIVGVRRLPVTRPPVKKPGSQ